MKKYSRQVSQALIICLSGIVGGSLMAGQQSNQLQLPKDITAPVYKKSYQVKLPENSITNHKPAYNPPLRISSKLQASENKKESTYFQLIELEKKILKEDYLRSKLGRLGYHVRQINQWKQDGVMEILIQKCRKQPEMIIQLTPVNQYQYYLGLMNAGRELIPATEHKSITKIFMSH